MALVNLGVKSLVKSYIWLPVVVLAKTLMPLLSTVKRLSTTSSKPKFLIIENLPFLALNQGTISFWLKVATTFLPLAKVPLPVA